MLVTKDENIKTSSVYVGSLILTLFQNKRVAKLTLFEVSDFLRKHQVVHYRQVFFGLAFLYVSNVIEFDEPYISIVSGDWNPTNESNRGRVKQERLF